MARSFLQASDLNKAEVAQVFELCRRFKKGELKSRPLEGKGVACLFMKESLRTRISFEVGISQLGGHPMYITDKEVKLGQRETIADAARVLSRYVAMIVIRTFAQSDVEGLAKWGSVPVVNALTDLEHPCQIFGDYYTIMEHLPGKERYKIAYMGDGNNITNSFLALASVIPIDFRVGTAADCQPSAEMVKLAKANPDSRILMTEDPKEAVAGADVVYTDVWASMGFKDQAEAKAEKLRKYQVNSSLMAGADPKAIVMHCLPAERGREITDEVIDGPQSVIFDQAENRLHIQKALMAFLLS